MEPKRRVRAASPVVGWREWLTLPDLGVPAIKAKIDTGARTSALHAEEIQRFRRRGKPWVRFIVHPLQQKLRPAVSCQAPVVDERIVTDSGGHRERRLVIVTQIAIGPHEFPAELTLARRDEMKFRMLLGRTALAGRFVVDPRGSYRLGHLPSDAYPDA